MTLKQVAIINGKKFGNITQSSKARIQAYYKHYGIDDFQMLKNTINGIMVLSNQKAIVMYMEVGR